MAKSNKRQKTVLKSTAGTGHFYTTLTSTLIGKEITKFDPVVRKHVTYKGSKLK